MAGSLSLISLGVYRVAIPTKVFGVAGTFIPENVAEDAVYRLIVAVPSDNVLFPL
jgi:hypothetical protein